MCERESVRERDRQTDTHTHTERERERERERVHDAEDADEGYREGRPYCRSLLRVYTTTLYYYYGTILQIFTTALYYLYCSSRESIMAFNRRDSRITFNPFTATRHQGLI